MAATRRPPTPPPDARPEPSRPDLLDCWLTTTRAAAYADLHPETLRRAHARGDLHAERLNGTKTLRFRRSELDRWLVGGTARWATHPGPLSRPPAPPRKAAVPAPAQS